MPNAVVVSEDVDKNKRKTFGALISNTQNNETLPISIGIVDDNCDEFNNLQIVTNTQINNSQIEELDNTNKNIENSNSEKNQESISTTTRHWTELYNEQKKKKEDEEQKKKITRDIL
jgi:hypothetical protein